MELTAQNVFISDGGSQHLSVLGFSYHRFFAIGSGVGVNEINVVAVFDVFKKRVRADEFESVPTDLWDLEPA